MEGRGSYRAREAHRPASLAGYNKIWCAVPPSCRGAAAPLFYAQTLLLPSMQRWCMACCWTTTLRLSVWQGTGQHTLLKTAKKGWQQTGQMPAVAIAPFLFIAVCRLSFLRAWDNQTSLVPRVIEAVVGIVKFERIMFGHNNVTISIIFSFLRTWIKYAMFFRRAHDQIRQFELNKYCFWFYVFHCFICYLTTIFLPLWI